RMWPELLDVVDQRSLLAISAGERADLAFRAAQIVDKELGEPDAAIGRYGAVLELVPRHAGARAALDELLQRDEHLQPVADALEKAYGGEREVDGLVRLYERRLSATATDPVTRRGHWAALAEVHEAMRGDAHAAFQTWARALAESPDELDLLQPLERLA